VGRIEELRAEVDQVDDRLLELFVRRARLARSIGEEKRAAAIALVDPRREEEIISRQAAKTGDATAPLDARAVRRLWAAVLTECRRVVVELDQAPDGGKG
jgi:chorismate mutase / prephenate dehydratase